MYTINHYVTFMIRLILLLITLSNLASAQNTSVEVPPIQKAEAIEICDAAQTAGFLNYGGFLLNPKDFQSLQLQNVVHPYLKRLDQSLMAKNIELITLVLPPRSVIFPQAGAASQAKYEQLILDLEQTGISTIPIQNVLKAYSADFFFPFDHHWTPFAAREVAKLIDGLLDVPLESRQVFTSSQIRHSWSPHDSRLKALSTLCGYNYLNKFNRENSFLTAWSTSMSASEGLFDTRDDVYTKPSALVGTSNSESPTLNFAGFLSEQTGQSISNYSFASSGALGSMMRYFLSEEYEQAKPRYLFWEFLANPHTTDYSLNSIMHYRQIIPSIFGSCESTSLATANYSLDDTAKRQYISLFQSDDVFQTIQSPKHYLSFTLKGDYIDRIIIEIEYSTGQIDQNTIALLPSSIGQQKSFLEFLDSKINKSGTITKINLSFPPATYSSDVTEVQIDLCKTTTTD